MSTVIGPVTVTVDVLVTDQRGVFSKTDSRSAVPSESKDP